MACNGQYQPDYACPGWLRLRATIIDRDAHRCRNYGSPEKLEVHHWRPLPEHEDAVNEHGYARGNCPLIGHDSGLITLCVVCHDALTEGRTLMSLRNNPLLAQLEAKGTPKLYNIFQL